MPPESSVRYSSPLARTSRSTKQSAARPRASESVQTKGGKRKHPELDDVYAVVNIKSKKGRKEGMAEEEDEEEREEVEDQEDNQEEDQPEEEEEEEDEEEEEQIEAEEEGPSQGGIGNIVKDLSIRFQSKKGKKTAKTAEEENKLVTKLDEMFDQSLTESDDLEAGETGFEQRKQRIDEFMSDYTTASTQANKNLDKLQNVNDAREARLHAYRPKLVEYLHEYHVPMVDALRATRNLYEKRPKAIQDTIRYFAKLQKQKMKQNEERTQVHLDAKAMIKHSRKLMRAAARAGR